MKIEIIERGRATDTRVLIDGQDVTQSITGYQIKHTVGELPSIHLDVRPDFLTFQATVEAAQLKAQGPADKKAVSLGG